MTPEQSAQNRIRLQAAKDQIMLWRNNSGVLPDSRGVPVRFGLGNDSKSVNENYKSSDLIGITPLLIQPQHVGQWVGVFTSVEVKPEGWVYLVGRDDRADAQHRWCEHVKTWGGYAGFATTPDEVRAICGR